MKYIPRSLILPLLLLTAVSCTTGIAIAETLIPLHIAKGTNLISLARKYCRSERDWHELARINHLSPPYLIIEDKTLQFPLSFLQTEQLTATLGAVHGSVLRTTADGRQEPLHKNDILLPGETVATGRNGYAHLIFPDNRFTRVESDSAMTLTYLIRLKDQALKAEFFLEKGRIVHSVRQKLKEDENFDTRTPIALTGVRGTEFRLKISGEKANLVETLAGVVQVTAKGTETALPIGQGLRVAASGLAEPPRVLPAAPNPTGLAPVYRTLPAIFTAPQHPRAAQIRVRLTADTEGNDTVLEQTVAPGHSFNIVSLADATYQAFLTAIDKDGFESPATGPLALKIRTIPSAPMISSPKNNGTFFTKTVEFRWLQGEQAASFEIQLANDTDFKHLIHSAKDSRPRFTTPELQPGTYFFKVRAIADDSFVSDFSPPVTIKISAEPKLTGNTATDALSLRWTPLGEKVLYDFQMARDKSFSHPIVSLQKLRKPEFAMDGYLAPGDYFIRIRGVLEDGQMSPWTPAQKLTVEPGPLKAGHIVTLIALLGIILL
jgi:hypothetical protein